MDKPNKYLTDKDILNAIRNGEEGGIETLYRKYFNVIEVFVYKNKGIFDEAKDIAQETVIVFYEKVRKPDFELTCALKTYLYSIARNLWLKELKRKGKTPMVIDTTSDYLTFEQTDEVAHKEEEEELIQKCMRYVNTLGENCKEILFHVFWNKWKMDQIAKEMNYTNADNAKNQKAKCMKRLRKLCLSLKKM